MSEAQQPLNALPQGHRLQEYELVRVLGMGGFGMTYLSFDHHLDKAFAIKEYLPSDIATRTADHSVAPQASDFRGDFQWGLERFLDEARTLARFDHRHIVKVHRFFEAHGTAYIVMEYVEGETLSAYLERKGTLSEAELKGILYPILDGLAVVHGANFLHRDIKPGNIILRAEDSSPVLLDFGAARQAIGAKSRSVTSIVTPGYAPIEQYSSRGHQGAWTDIYALGGVCYRALTGQVPDDATDRMRHDPLVPVSQRCAGQASQEFLSAIDVALTVDEEDRPQSVGAWREALEASSTSAQSRRQGEGERRREQATQRLPLPVPTVRTEEAKPLVDAVAAAQKDTAADATVVRRSEQNAPPSKSPKQPLFKWLAIALGVVAVLVGGKMYVDHAEQVALEKPPLMDPAGEVLNEQAPDEFSVRLETNAGPVVIQVTRDWSPRGADRLYNLVRNGFYDDQRFFRVVPGFVVQWGLSGNPELTQVWHRANILDDPVKQSNTRGRITYAKTNQPNTRTTQLFINLGDNSKLDGMGFAPFGEVVEGMEVVDQINAEYGQQPSQGQVAGRGNAYLEENFPNLDYIIKAEVID